MKTGNLLAPWFTYVNTHEVKEGKQKVSFGGMDYSPGINPQTYWIDEPINPLTLLFRMDFS